MQCYGDGAGEGRVYVNNMNTPHATTTLPEHTDLVGGGGGGGDGSRYASERSVWMSEAERRRTLSLQAMTTATAMRGGERNGARASFVVLDDGSYNNAAAMAMMGGSSSGGSGGVVDDDDDGTTRRSGAAANDDATRQRLARVYERITRQLQRQLNYEEVARVPLHEQFGVSLASEHVASAAAATSVADRASDAAAAATAVPAAAASRLVRYDAEGDAAARKTHMADDEERVLAQQPCPAPLRLVMQHVQATVRDKLALAERSSLRECLRYTFECRALLNRLLKEMPMYAQFHESMAAARHDAVGYNNNNNSGSSGSTAMPSSVQLQQLYHTFRQQPVLLPRGVYTEDRRTGTIGAALDMSHEHALVVTHTHKSNNNSGGSSDTTMATTAAAAASSTATTTTTQQQQAASATTMTTATATRTSLPSLVPATSVSTTTTMAADGSLGGGVTTQVRLPPGYGCSVRLRNNNNNSNNNTMDAFVAGGGEYSAQGSLPPHGNSSAAAAASFGLTLPSVEQTTSITDDAAGTQSSLSQQQQQQSQAPLPLLLRDSTSARRELLRMQRSGAATLQQLQRKATQCVSVGIVTDDNVVTSVSRDAYAQLQERVKELEVQVQEARGERATLLQQLREQDDDVASRAAVVQYLRSTLVRECNFLRTQLCYAAQREQQQQQHVLLVQGPPQQLQQQQQQQSSVGTPAAALGISMSRSLAPRSAAATSMSARSGGGGGAGALSHTPRVSQSMLATESSNSNNNNNAELSMTQSIVQQQQQQGLVAVSVMTTPAATAPQSASSAQQRTQAAAGSGGGGGGVTMATTGDLAAVQSLLDVVLLAVEKDEALLLPSSPHRRNSASHDDKTATMVSGCSNHGCGDMSCISHHNSMVATTATTADGGAGNGRHAAVLHVARTGSGGSSSSKGGSHSARCWREARAEFERRKCALKHTVAAMHARQAVVVAAKDREIARLRGLMDWRFVQHAMTERVHALRAECRRVRNFAQEQLHTFQMNMQTSLAALLNRARLVDRTSSDHVALQNTVEALRDLVASAHTLLMPMLTREYAHGYHPWPLKVRNSVDPLAHIVQTRYGLAEVVRVREELSRLSELYVALHRCVVQHTVTPELARPMCGVTLRELCAALLLHPMSSPDVLYAVRRYYEVERDACKQLARLNARIAWSAYLQQTYTERAVAALREGGMNPLTTTLPAAGRINALARQREALTRARASLQRARNDNAKEVYALWKERQIDIYDGRPVVGVQHRMTLFYDAHTATRRRSTSTTTAAAAAMLAA